ncbi:TfoX/Sxy family protein [Litorivivens sp.]|uniref:TfoX/Sxy family protein n=1 Tax=Litorivivens sp. TaxID=2020868 RepID=UPI003565429A
MLQGFDDRGFTERVLEWIPGADRVQLRLMFGGVGLFEHNAMFAISVNNQLYLKADSETRTEFEQRGLEPFHYDRADHSLTLDFYQAPPEVFVRANTMAQWVNRARTSAFRAKASNAA